MNTLDSTYKSTTFRKLNKSVYGILQEVMIFYDEITKFLTSKCFKIYEGETCLINKVDIYIGLYVDDLLVIVLPDKVQNNIEELKNRF